MSKISKMVENYNTVKVAKKHGRTFNQQKYRNNLAKNLIDKRKKGDEGKKIAISKLNEEKGDGKYLYSLGENRKVGKDVAERLIEEGDFKTVIMNLDKFEGLNKEILIKLVDSGEGRWEISTHLDKFEGLDKELAEDWFNRGWGGIVAEYIQCFEGLNHQEFAEKMTRGYRNARDLVYHLENFQGIDYKKIAIMLIDAGYSDYLAYVNFIDKFKGLDEEVARKLTEKGYGKFVAMHPEKFGLKKEK